MENHRPKGHHRRGVRRLAACGTLIALGLLASACGSSGSKTSTGSTGSNASTTTSASGSATASRGGSESSALQAAQKLVATASQIGHGTFPMPTTSVKPGNRKIFIISPNQADPYSGFAIKNFEAAAKVMGWQVSPIHDAAGSAATAAGFMEQAVQGGYNAIYYPQMQIGALSTPIKNALAAHMVIDCPDCVAAPEYGKDFITPAIDYPAMGTALAAYAVVKSGGSGRFLVYPDPQYPFIEQEYTTFTKYLKQNCPKCSVSTSDYTTAYLTQQGPPVWTSALSNNPAGSVKAAIAPFPFAAQQLLETEHNQGRKDIPLMDFGAAEAPTNQLMAEGTVPYVGTITAPEVYEDWISADLIARALDNQPLYKVTDLPGTLTTPSNVKSMLNGSSSPGFDFQSKLEKLWGK